MKNLFRFSMGHSFFPCLAILALPFQTEGHLTLSRQPDVLSKLKGKKKKKYPTYDECLLNLLY